MSMRNSPETLVHSKPGKSRRRGTDIHRAWSDVDVLSPESTARVTRTADDRTADSRAVPMPSTRDVGEWTLEYLLLGDLADLLNETYDEENRRWIQVVLEALLDAIAAEKRGERFRRLRAAYPESRSMLQALTQLETEHEIMVAQLQRLRNRVAWRLSLLEVVGAEVVRDLQRWLTTFRNFYQRDHRLEDFEDSKVNVTSESEAE